MFPNVGRETSIRRVYLELIRPIRLKSRAYQSKSVTCGISLVIPALALIFHSPPKFQPPKSDLDFANLLATTIPSNARRRIRCPACRSSAARNRTSSSLFVC